MQFSNVDLFLNILLLVHIILNGDTWGLPSVVMVSEAGATFEEVIGSVVTLPAALVVDSVNRLAAAKNTTQ